MGSLNPVLCAVPENIHRILPSRRGLEFLGVREFWKTKKLKEMYET